MGIFPSSTAFGRILSIFPALQRLQYRQGTSFPFNHRLQPRSVSRDPLPRISSLRLVPNSGTSPFFDGLLEFLNTTTAISHLSELHGNLSPHLLVQTEEDYALHKLTKYIGASLRTLHLHAALPSQSLCHISGDRFDISENTQLVHLALTSAVNDEHVLGLCNALHDILSSVTSARITKVEIDFKIDDVTYDAVVERLRIVEDGLARIDAMLSTPIFGALTEVVIGYNYTAQPAVPRAARHSRRREREKDMEKAIVTRPRRRTISGSALSIYRSANHASSSKPVLPAALPPVPIRPAPASSGPPLPPRALRSDSSSISMARRQTFPLSGGPSPLQQPQSLDVDAQQQAPSHTPLEDRVRACLPKLHRRGILLVGPKWSITLLSG